MVNDWFYDGQWGNDPDLSLVDQSFQLKNDVSLGYVDLFTRDSRFFYRPKFRRPSRRSVDPRYRGRRLNAVTSNDHALDLSTRKTRRCYGDSRASDRACTSFRANTFRVDRR